MNDQERKLTNVRIKLLHIAKEDRLDPYVTGRLILAAESHIEALADIEQNFNDQLENSIFIELAKKPLLALNEAYSDNVAMAVVGKMRPGYLKSFRETIEQSRVDFLPEEWACVQAFLDKHFIISQDTVKE